MKIAGAGCSLLDAVWANVDFASPNFEKYKSHKPGDGGLTPGQLVFTEELEAFAGEPYAQLLATVTGGAKAPDATNLGGPCIIALALATQLLGEEDAVAYYGALGQDDYAREILKCLGHTRMDLTHYVTLPGTTPFTDVLSDPRHDAGRGERTFINNIGAAWNYGPAQLPASFFEADIALLGATALVPQLHDALSGLLAKAKQAGAVTVVTTVYDFRNDKKRPGQPWPLGEEGQTAQCLQKTDLFVVDAEEGLKISGQTTLADACGYFATSGVSAFAVTHGAHPVHYFSDGRLFAACELNQLPVSQAVGQDLARPDRPAGDTTGCGDNFAGGMLTSLATQLKTAPKGQLSLPSAVALGVCCGGAACFHLGGLMAETRPGQKRQLVLDYYQKYRQQIAGTVQLPEQAL